MASSMVGGRHVRECPGDQRRKYFKGKNLAVTSNAGDKSTEIQIEN